ncbi:tetratricopeptide repeat protein [Desulfothermus okinawensis]
MRRNHLKFLVLLFFISACATTNPPLITRDVRARLDLAQSYILKQEPRLAFIELKKIENKAKRLPYFYFLKGLVYLQTKEIKKAILSLSYATKLDPGYGDAWNNLGLAYLADKQEKKAISCFEKALSIETYETPEYAAHNLALIYKKKGELDNAIFYEKKALTLNWRYLPAYLSIIDLYIKKAEIPSAIYWIKKGIESYPDNPDLYYLLGENYLRLGKRQDAKKAFLQVLSLDKGRETKFAKMARDYLDILK